MKRVKLLAIFIVTGTILLSSFSFYGYQIIRSPNILVDKDDRYLYVPHGTDFKALQHMLFRQDIVQDMVSFSFLAKLMKYNEQVKPGRYLMRKNMSNTEAIRLLRAGNHEPVKITFQNIRLIGGLSEVMCKNLFIRTKTFDKALDAFIQDNPYGFDERTIIAMFIPNTYEVYYDITAEQLIERMKSEYDRFWNADRKAKAKAIGLTPLEVSTLASLVQTEQMSIIEERKRIAGLYINRLKRGIKLDSDPTLVFASGDFSLKRVLNEHKLIDSPYNTYKNAGLPPGPIYMPDISAIDAVLNYEEHDFLYMCAKEDFSGYHNFAETLREHTNNAIRYQRALTIEMNKRKATENL